MRNIEKLGYGDYPVCMAKTQYSLSDDKTKLGRPTGFTINIREVYISAGAGFVVAITGKHYDHAWIIKEAGSIWN